MNTDNLRSLVKNIDSDLFELINHVICSICQELLTKPVTTPCAHSFCSGCIKRVVSSKDNSGCPLCKNPVKRYSLETDNVKSTLTEIFRELPAAFEKDVQDLSAGLSDTTEDLLKNSKLAQLSGQDYEKDVKSTKRKTSVTKKSQKPSNKSENANANDNDVDSFVPVLKRSENVIVYASAKKKKMDDLISISQREVEYDSGVCDTSGLDKKLEQIEKVSPEEKINEWFKAVGSNIYLSSPGSNHFDLPPTKNLVEGQSFSKDAQEDDDVDSSTMIRSEYKKVANPLHSKENEKEVVSDPYEFVPSQNKKIVRRRRKKSVEKKIPDFKAIQSFSKENVKRHAVVLNEEKEDGERENERDVSLGNEKSSSEFPAMATTPDVITASQKFDKLLLESKENEKKGNAKAHVLYSASQASSTEFLDCSYHSQVAEVKKVPKRRKSRLSFKKTRKPSSKQESFSNLIPNKTRFSTKCLNTESKTENGEGSERSERKHSLDGDEAKADKRQSFSEIMDLRSEEAFDLEKSVEEYLMKFKKDKSLKGTSCEKTSQQTKTKLMGLLEELVNDDVVYKNPPGNTPVALKNQSKAEEKDSEANCKKIPPQSKTKLMGLLEELVNNDTVYKTHLRNSPVEVKNPRKVEEKEKNSKSSFCENTSLQKKTKLNELLEELVSDNTVHKNHPRSASVEMKNQRKAEDIEKDPKVSSCEKTSQQKKTKLNELLEELVTDDVVYKNHPRNTPVIVQNQRKVEDKEKDSKVSSCEKTSQQKKTKLNELLEELVNDDTVYKNHPRNAPVEVKNQRKAEDIEKDSKVGFCEKTSQQTKTKLNELLDELVYDDTMYKNHARNTPVEMKNQRKAEEKEKDSNVSSCEKTSQQTKKKLNDLLEELVNDDSVYKNHPKNSPAKVKKRRKAEDNVENTSHQQQNIGFNSNSSGREEISKQVDDLKSGKCYTQGTHLLGFSTQEELVDERKFKEMVNKMEKELKLRENDLKRTSLEQSNEKRDESSPLDSSCDKESPSPNSNFSKNKLENSSFIRFNCLGKIKKSKNVFINFLHLGRLTPTVKRSRSSVVKLVFPIGFSSFARKRAIQDQLPASTNSSKSLLSDSHNSSKDKICVPPSRNDHVSTGIQTSQKLVSSAEIQTSHLSKSVIVQTSQIMNPSVEIQTVKESCCAGIQTSQMPTSEKSRIYKSAQIQTSQCESSPMLKDNDMETEYIPDSVGYDEPEILPKEKISRDFEVPERSFRKLRSPKNRTCCLENEIKEFSSRVSTKRKSLSPAKKHIYKHRKISSRKKEKTCSPESRSPDKAQDGRSQDKPSTSSLIVDSEMRREFDETWMRKSQEDLVESKNKRNRGEEEDAVSKEHEISSPAEKKSNSSFILNLSGLIDEVLQKFETRQRIPLDVRKVSTDDVCEMIDLATPESVQQNSQEQLIQVLKNIDLDLKGRGSKKGNGRAASMSESWTKGEKSEESDSDFFVEQTPPRPSRKAEDKEKDSKVSFCENTSQETKTKLNELLEELVNDDVVYKNHPRNTPVKVKNRPCDQEHVNSSKFEGRRSSCIEKVEKEEDDGKKTLNSQGSDLIGDSLPKDQPETESFLMVSAPQKVLTSEKKGSNNVSYLEKRGKSGSQSFPKEKSFSTIHKLENFPKANENDQNQLNAASETKLNQVRTWTKAEESPRVKTRQKFYIAASSVKNLDMIKKFVVKFKMEYLYKPSKNMTHLIVGLHENEEEGDVLPLCTPKLLFAMANKKWIVSEAWAETCLKMDAVVPEENFETLDPVGGHGCRNARLSTQPLLKDCEIYLLGNFLTISKEDFAGLILDCGGTVIQKPEQFSFSPLKLRMIVADQDCLNMDKNQLQELHENYSTVILSRDIILMSIQSYKLVNFIPHLLHPTSEEELLRMGYPSQLVRCEEEDSSSTSSNWK